MSWQTVPVCKTPKIRVRVGRKEGERERMREKKRQIIREYGKEGEQRNS